MKRELIVLHAALILLLCISCKKGSVSAPPVVAPPVKVVTVDDDTKDYGPYESFPANNSKTLNVIYFLPSDYKGPLNQYQRRISKMMLFMQDWYKKEMKSYGFGDKTFGLLRSKKDNNYIKIIVVRGKENKFGYPYEGGGSKAITEINEYFARNPAEKSSEHSLVFLPSITGDGKGNNEGGVPFYGLGKFCFALDYRYFDVSYFPQQLDTAKTGWIAGTIHELGHGLNLPHNTQKVSDNFISLMHDHMAFESNNSKSHITFADACILNTSEVFNSAGHPYYKESANLNVKSLRIYADNENLYFRAKFSSSLKVNAVIVYNDPKTSEGDGDYNSVTWASNDIHTVAGGDSVSITMPLNEILTSYKQYPFDMRIRFCHENGVFSYQSFKYVFDGGIKPSIDEEMIEFKKLQTSGWTVVANSTSPESPTSNLFDGNSSSIWHSKWSGGVDPLPHHLKIDMGNNKAVSGIAFISRQDRSDGRPRDIRIEVSSNGTDWTLVSENQLADSPVRKTIRFEEVKSGRYFRITILNVYAGTIVNPVYTHLAELEFF